MFGSDYFNVKRENLGGFGEKFEISKSEPKWTIWIGLQPMIYYLLHLTQPVKMKLLVHSELLNSENKYIQGARGFSLMQFPLTQVITSGKYH